MADEIPTRRVEGPGEVYTAEVTIPPARIRLKLDIDNYYGGEVVKTTRSIIVTVPPEDKESDEYEDWLNDQIMPATGTGRTEGDAAYFVKVTKSSYTRAIPVDTEYEFGL